MSGNEEALYERDFVIWADTQAVALRRAADAGSNLPLDWYNIAEEIESLGRSQRRELKSRVANLIQHLLKLEISSASRPRAGWLETVDRERREIELLLDDSPSLRGEVAAIASAVWPRSVRSVRHVLAERGEASREGTTEIGATAYTLEQLFGDWLPPRASSGLSAEGASRGSP